jgi:hypothetical protein
VKYQVAGWPLVENIINFSFNITPLMEFLRLFQGMRLFIQFTNFALGTAF